MNKLEHILAKEFKQLCDIL